MELTVYSHEGEDTGKKVKLNEAIFAVEPNDHAIYLDVKQYRANSRQGTHKAKERSEIIGSTRKIKKQKGTGTARAGSIKSPLFRGGGRVFGPRPRNYRFKLNRKVKQLARKSALTYKARENKITVVENLNFDQPKTKQMISLRSKLELSNKKSLFILSNENKNVYLSARNLQEVKILTVSELTTYDVLDAANICFEESSINTLHSIFVKDEKTSNKE